MPPLKVLLALSATLIVTVACKADDSQPSARDRRALRSAKHLSVMYSVNTPRDVFESFFSEGDYVRTDIDLADGAPRRSRYALVTTLRLKWNGHPGVRAWTERGCGREAPGLIVYDPEFRPEWTPPGEPERLAASVRRAARMVRATGCHRFGIAPGALPFFGLDPVACEVDLTQGAHRDLPWRWIDLVDIQAQRLLGDHCLQRGGIELYEETVSRLARFFKTVNPNIEVLAQVSFRDSPAETMKRGISRVAGEVDGVYFSYPTKNPDFPCRYCRRDELEVLLRYLNG